MDYQSDSNSENRKLRSKEFTLGKNNTCLCVHNRNKWKFKGRNIIYSGSLKEILLMIGIYSLIFFSKIGLILFFKSRSASREL